MNTSPTHGNRLALYGFVLVAACLGLSQFSIFLAQTAFAAAAIAWIIVAFQDGRRPETPAFFLPLLVYCALTLVSAAVSLDPVASLVDSKQLLLFLMVPIVVRLCGGPRAMTVLNVIIAFGAASAMWGVVQFAVFGQQTLDSRPDGPLTHYMTFSGVIMLVTCATVARLLFHQREWIWPAIALPALLVAVAATQSRSAYVGTFVALTALAALRRPRLVLLMPVVAAALFVLAPSSIKARVLSIGDLNNATIRDRVAMLRVGAGIVSDYPVFGVGPEMVESVYRDYRPEDYVNEVNPHLHNVPMQIAAERGLLALFAWLWFVIVAARDLFSRVWASASPALPAAGLAALVAMLFAGLFEYNFGDSEFLMLFLGLIALPFAAGGERQGDAEGRGQRAEGKGEVRG